MLNCSNYVNSIGNSNDADLSLSMDSITCITFSGNRALGLVVE